MPCMDSRGRAGRLRRLLPPLLFVGLLAAVLLVASRARLERADVVFNNGGGVRSLDPAAATDVPSGRVVGALFEGLCSRHPRTLRPVPGQAESWEISPNRTDYTFHIRADARWSDGEPVSAEDFEWSFRRLLHPATAAEYAYQLWYVVGARTYSTWPGHRLYPDTFHWVERVEDGRVRVGVTSMQLKQIGSPQGLRVPVVGQLIYQGERLAEALSGNRRTAIASPVSGEVTAVNPRWVSSPRELPQEWSGPEGWLVELEPIEATEGELAAMSPGEDFREEVLWPRVAIRAVDSRTLRIRLKSPTPYFLDILASPPLCPVSRRALEEARQRWPASWEIEWLRPGRLVTNGPFLLRERRIRDRIRLVRNPGYWDAGSVAMRSIDILSVDHHGTALNLYLTGECDWLNGTIPSDLAPHLAKREDFGSVPYLGAYFYRINTTRPPLDDPRLRRALAMSIDRQAICEMITKAGQRPALALVPDAMPGYTNQPFGAEDPFGARRLLAQAGYGPRKRPLPAIEILFNTSEAHKDIAEVIADGWNKILGLEVKLKNQEWKVYLDTQNQLGYEISRSVWIADYPDPASFLELFVTDGRNNRTGWGHPEYDRLIEAARTEWRPPRRRELLQQAEALLMEQMPILPIYFYASQNLVNPRLGGFFENAQDEHHPKHWYWMDDTELAERRRETPRGRERAAAPGPGEGLYPPDGRAGGHGGAGD